MTPSEAREQFYRTANRGSMVLSGVCVFSALVAYFVPFFFAGQYVRRASPAHVAESSTPVDGSATDVSESEESRTVEGSDVNKLDVEFEGVGKASAVGPVASFLMAAVFFYLIAIFFSARLLTIELQGGNLLGGD